MTIDQKNNYLPNQDLGNLANNVDYNRLGVDKTNISVNFTTSPATVSIKQGSIIEANGNLYIVSGADETFQMANATDNYIAFDEITPAFQSVSSKGTYNDSKAGVYQASPTTTRTLRWYIDQTEETYNIDDSIMAYNIGDLKTEVNSNIIDSAGTGIQLYSASGISADHFSDSFTLYKPCTLVVITDALTRQTYPAGTTAVQMPSWQVYVDLEYNGGWNAFMDLGVGGYQDTIRTSQRTIDTFLVCLNPGKYRIALIENYATGGPYILEVRLVSVYGQTNFDAGSVYA